MPNEDRMEKTYRAKANALVVVLDRIKTLVKLVKPLEKAIAAGRGK